MRYIQGRGRRGDHWAAEEGEVLTNDQQGFIASFHPSIRRAYARYHDELMSFQQFHHEDINPRIAVLRFNLLRAEALYQDDEDEGSLDFMVFSLPDEWQQELLLSYLNYRQIALRPDTCHHAHMYYMHLNLLLTLMVKASVDFDLAPFFRD